METDHVLDWAGCSTKGPFSAKIELLLRTLKKSDHYDGDMVVVPQR